VWLGFGNSGMHESEGKKMREGAKEIEKERKRGRERNVDIV